MTPSTGRGPASGPLRRAGKAGHGNERKPPGRPPKPGGAGPGRGPGQSVEQLGPGRAGRCRIESVERVGQGRGWTGRADCDAIPPGRERSPPGTGVDRIPPARLAEAQPGAAVGLARVFLAYVEDVGDLAVAVSERPAQHEHGPLGGGQLLHQGEHRERDRLALLGGLQHAEYVVAPVGPSRFRQPRADVEFATRSGRGESVQADVGQHLRQPRGGLAHGVVVAPSAKVRVLYRVLGLARRPEQPIPDREQPRAMRLELPGRRLPRAVLGVPMGFPGHRLRISARAARPHVRAGRYTTPRGRRLSRPSAPPPTASRPTAPAPRSPRCR